MSTERKLERPKSLTAIAKDSIRTSIISGDLKFGSQLSESILAERFGVSKTPVREALLQLKLEGLVDIQPQSGTFVFDPTEEQVREICRFREIIEPAALELAIRERPEQLAKRLGATLAAKKPRSRSGNATVQSADSEFHGAIIECSGNAYLQAAYQLIADKINALRARLAKDDHRVDACQDTHGAIVALVEQRNAALACETLRTHIHSTEESYIRALHIETA